MRVLVVDDEPAVRDALGRALRLDGFDVQTATDGRDVIRRLPDVRPDAVLLDVLMPGRPPGGGVHQGSAVAESPAGGGARLRLRLPAF